MTTSEVILERRNAVSLNADVVDYTAHMASNPDHLIRTMQQLEQIVAAGVSGTGGRIVDFVGDNFMALFDDAESAMAAAVAICTGTQRLAADAPRDRRVGLRMGLDLGEVMTSSDGAVFGEPINIAARVQALAGPGGIAVSERVYIALDRPELRFTNLGSQRLKNVPERIAVYRLAGLGSEVPSGARVTHEPVSIAVIPFVSTVDADVSHAADAIRRDIIDALGHIPMVSVIDARSDDNPVARDDTNTRYLLESGLIRSGERLRAYAQLLETDTMNRVWGHRWEGTMPELFDMQDTITRDVVRAVEVDLVVGEPARIYRSMVAPRAVTEVYEGWYHLVRNSRPDWAKALAAFERAADLDPASSVGPALASFAYWHGAMNGLSDDPVRDLETAGRHAERGMQRNDPTGLSQMVIAALAISGGGDLDEALETAHRVVALRPTCDVTFGVEAAIERYRGNWRHGLDAAQRAIDLSPVIKPWYTATMAGCLYLAGRYREAADHAETVIEVDPTSLDAHLVLASSREALGQHRLAAATVDLIRNRFPAFSMDDLSVHPFVDPVLLDRWRSHLGAAGLS